MVNSLVYRSIPRKARGGGRGVNLTPLKEKVKTPMPILPNIEGDYNIKEIIRDKLNKRTNVYILFLK